MSERIPSAYCLTSSSTISSFLLVKGFRTREYDFSVAYPVENHWKLLYHASNCWHFDIKEWDFYFQTGFLRCCGFNWEIDMAMQDLIKALKELLDIWEKKAVRVSTLLISELSAILILLWVFTQARWESFGLLQYAVMGVVAVSIFVIWYKNRKLPRTRKGHVGFVVAISTETEQHRTKIEQDFVLALNDLIQKGNLPYRFHFFELPEHHSVKINDVEEARKYLHRTRSRFMVFGRAKVRHLMGEDRHVLILNGIVAHKEVPIEVSKQFAAEFSELFPRKLQLSMENDLFLFEVTSELVNLVARYIMGIASLLSIDVNYAESVFEDLKSRIEKLQTNVPAIVKIRQRVPFRLTEVYSAQVRLRYNAWKKTKNLTFVKDMETYLDKLAAVSPSDYSARLMRSIWLFLVRRDIASAIGELRKCRDVRDPIWQFNLAFLHAYKGDMKMATRHYNAAFRFKEFDQEVIFDIEEFISWVADLESDKVQLYYCLGLINYHAKGDKVRAMQDFKKFLDVVPAASYEIQRSRASKYVDDIMKGVKEDA
jgi:tetratricopeptide (TPR) repeat protein